MIKNPITDHLPTGCRKIGTSYRADLCVDLNQFATNQPIVFVVGAMAHGKVYNASHQFSHWECCGDLFSGVFTQVEVDYTEKEVSISRYPLSAALTCTKLCTAFEHAWDVV